MSTDSFAVTLDVDWATDQMLEDVIGLLSQYGVRATFFATHKSPLLESLDRSRYEIGIHPNFKGVNDYGRVIRELVAMYPEAVGVRSHGLFESSEILALFVENGLKYDVNTFIPLRENLYPFLRLNRLVRIPFYWGDDAYFASPASFGVPPFGFSGLRVDKPGLKVYNFHPVHIYMNTCSASHYRDYKQHYHSMKLLEPYRNLGKGVRTLFIGLLAYLSRNEIPSSSCHEICDQFTERERTP